VQVDLASGLLTVETETPVDAALIEAAVKEAGYALADVS
jgi:copper chaperone CopZ